MRPINGKGAKISLGADRLAGISGYRVSIVNPWKNGVASGKICMFFECQYITYYFTWERVNAYG